MVATKPVERSVLGASCNDRESENDCRPQGYIDDGDGVKGVDEGRWSAETSHEHTGTETKGAQTKFPPTNKQR
jgi:hypothetical protein